MKRKVQAQRKFAHGAFVPNSISNGLSDRRITEVPCSSSREAHREEHRNMVHHNSMSAGRLLDLVSLQNVHQHKKPVVLLQRLQPEAVIKVNDKNLAQTINSPGSGTSSKLRKQKIYADDCEEDRLKLKRLKTKRVKEALSETSNDDDRPLKFLRKQEKPLRLQTLMCKNNAVKTTQSKSNKPRIRPSQVLRRSSRLIHQISNKAKKKSKHMKKRLKCTKKKLKSKSPPKLHTYSTACVEQNVTEAATSKQVNELSLVPKSDASKELPTKNLITVQDTNLQKVQSGYYGAEQIEKWMMNSSMNSSNEDNFKMPRLIYDGDNTSVSACPSERFSTVQDVVRAPKPDLKQCSTFCKKCDRVKKLHQLSSILQEKPELKQNINADVYEFNKNDLNTEKVPFVEFRRKSNSSHTNPSLNVIPTISLLSDDEEVDEICYLDILPPESGQIIQIKSVQVHKKQKKIMKARLVPNKGIKESERDISLIKHDILLDSLFKTFDLSSIQQLPLPVKTSESTLKESEPTKSTLHETGSKEASTSGCEKGKLNTGNIKCRPETSTNSRPQRNNAKKEVGPAPIKNPGENKFGDAPTFYPTAQEFADPLLYFEKIMPVAAQAGLCKVVTPDNFKPSCSLHDDVSFNVTNQYITRMFHRWGPAVREMSGMKATLFTQNFTFVRPPLIGGVEMNLPKLYQIVQENGGLNEVIAKKRWDRVCEQMRCTIGPNPQKKLDKIFVKYILPYATLSTKERHQILSAVEKGWYKKSQRMLDRTMNPLYRQLRLLEEIDSSEEEESEEPHVECALTEAEDCIVPGRRMDLAGFKKVAANIKQIYFSSEKDPSPDDVKRNYWQFVFDAVEHICVNSASIDTGEEGYGFTKNKNDPYGKHPWNLKMISQNPNNVLRFLGPVLGVTVPTLHLGMLFSTSCWHRDPHGLPWIEYMHSGPGKIWYSIPDDQSDNFRKAVEKLCPLYCQNKSIWLPSDVTMIPPKLLTQNNVSLCSIVQNPREFIIVLPKAYSCSISTGYTVSESVYFATNSYLTYVHQVFQELRESSEPTMFSLEQLLISMVKNTRTPLDVLPQVNVMLRSIIREELNNRRHLENLGVKMTIVTSKPRSCLKKNSGTTWSVKDQAECDFCRKILYLSKATGFAGKNVLCLEHTLRLLGKSNDDTKNLEVITFYTAAQLEYLMS